MCVADNMSQVSHRPAYNLADSLFWKFAEIVFIVIKNPLSLLVERIRPLRVQVQRNFTPVPVELLNLFLDDIDRGVGSVSVDFFEFGSLYEGYEACFMLLEHVRELTGRLIDQFIERTSPISVNLVINCKNDFDH